MNIRGVINGETFEIEVWMSYDVNSMILRFQSPLILIHDKKTEVIVRTFGNDYNFLKTSNTS